jgi:hypothetical protein
MSDNPPPPKPAGTDRKVRPRVIGIALVAVAALFVYVRFIHSVLYDSESSIAETNSPKSERVAAPVEEAPPVPAAEVVSSDPDWELMADSPAANVIISGYDAVRYAISISGAGADAAMAATYPGFKQKVDRLRTCCAALDADSGSLQALGTQLADSLDQLGSAIAADDRDLYVQALVSVKFRLADIKTFLPGQDRRASVPPADAAVASSPERPFNSLTFLAIDPATKQVTFHGDVDPDGPEEPVPYAQLLAAAMRLPPEAGPPGLTGSVPGFSLEPIQDLGAVLPHLMERLAGLQGTPELQRAMQNDEMAASFAEQSLGSLKGELWGYFAQKDPSMKWVFDFDRIESPDDLARFMKRWRAAGLIGEQDNAAMRQFFQAALMEPMNREGGLLFLPAGPMKQALNLHLTAHPTYYGIEEDTDLARIILDADLALKSLAGPRGHELAKKLPFHRTMLEWEVQQGGVAHVLSKANSPLGTIQVQPGQFELGISSDNSVVSFDGAALQIIVSGRTPGEERSPVQLEYARFATEHFDDYAHQVAPLWNIREAYKLVAAARLLQSRGIAVTLPDLDTSWRPPEEVESEWEFASVGLGVGKTPSDAVTYLGGVGVQIANRTQVKTISDERKKQLLPETQTERNDVLGRAGGYPIATDAAGLGAMDEADARANMTAMTPEQLEALQESLKAEEQTVSNQLEANKMRMLGVQAGAASPLQLKTWGDVILEKARDLPLNEFMENQGKDLAELADQGHAVGEGPTFTEQVKRLGELNDLGEMLRSGSGVLDGGMRERLNKVLSLPTETNWSAAEYYSAIKLRTADATQQARLLTKAGFEETRSVGSVVVNVALGLLEARAAYISFNEGKTWDEKTLKALPHIASALKDIQPTAGEWVKLAEATGAESSGAAQVASRGALVLAVTTTAIEVSSAAIDLRITNIQAKNQHAENKSLLAEAVGNRDGYSARLERNRKVQAIAADVAAEQ